MPMFVCLPSNLIPSRQNESHIFTKDLKMKPPMPTSQVNQFWFVEIFDGSAIRQASYFFRKYLVHISEVTTFKHSQPNQAKVHTSVMFFSTLQGNFSHFYNKIVEFVSNLALHMWIIPAWSSKNSIQNGPIDINNILIPHAGLILSRILNIHVVKYASVLSIQAHDEPNSNIIRTLMFIKTSFTKVIRPQNMRR